MEEKICKKYFFKALKESNLYYQFINELLRQNKVLEPIEDYIVPSIEKWLHGDQKSPFDYVSIGFLWHRSLKGDSFWKIHSSKFGKIFHKYIKNLSNFNI
jgi:hypothetical protein